jgi:condensin complex subunit 1
MAPSLYWPSTGRCLFTSAVVLISSRLAQPKYCVLESILTCSAPYQNRTLRAAATLSFSKFLCVSSQFCDQHHRLLFKILETSKDPNIRSNIVIALGDVAVSFSNIMDENSNELYKGLSDGDLVVKKNTLMVLTHLILNGMIKVKGQLGEMAKCLEDPEPRIADLAKLFFTELSTKENAIYNNLPDGTSVLIIRNFSLAHTISHSHQSPFNW